MLLWFMLPLGLSAQYVTNGSAVRQGQCFRLTTTLPFQTGSVWYLDKVDIGAGFELYFDIYLGCQDANGADGMAFVLQQVSTSVGTAGEGLGYLGVSPSLAVEFDTWQNPNRNDPVYDHLAIMSNGVPNHGTPQELAGPVGILPGNANAEDCRYHSLRVQWKADSQLFKVYVDCNLRLTYTGDIINDIFNGDSEVFWGFTAATGGSVNDHFFCLDYVSFTEDLQDTAICQGNSIQLSVGSGDTFSWSPATGLSDPTIANPVATPTVSTTYVATITDVCGQQRRDTVNIQVQQPGLDILPDSLEMCPDGITLRATTGFATYLWDDGSTDSLRFVDQPGTYTVSITNLCETWTESITVLPSSAVFSATPTDISCHSADDGRISVSLSNSQGPYLYTLLDAAGDTLSSVGSNGSSRNFGNLQPGTYAVSVQDARGCRWGDTLTLSQPDPLALTLTDFENIVCGGTATGSITAAGSGGTPPYQYSAGGPFQASNQLTGLGAGPQTVILRDANGCRDTAQLTLTENPPLQLTLLDTVAVGCFGASTGQISLSAAGGVGDYEFSLEGTTYQNANLFTGLSAGNYLAHVRDDSGCVATLNVNLDQRPELLLDTTALRGVDCAGNSTGALTVAASGGVPGYAFALDGGPFGSDSSFTGLAAGSYQVAVRDDSSCVTTLTVQVPEPPPLQALIDSVLDVACFGDSSGAVTLAAQGGSAPYRFACLGQAPDSLPVKTGFAIGSYAFEVVDDSLCRDTVSATVNQPDSLVIAVTDRQDVDCLGSSSGSLSAAANGGIGPYAYAINQGGFGPGATFDSLFAGFYTLRVQDQNGCEAEVDTLIATPTNFVAGIDVQVDVACFGDSSGSLLLRGQGGTAPYRYTYDGVNFTTDNFFPNLPASVDTIIAYDANDCIVPIPYEIRQPDSLGASVAFQRDVACFGDSSGLVHIAPDGGVRPYTYALQSGPSYPDSVISGLFAGNYTVVVRDDSACTAEVPVTITEPPLLEASLALQRNVDCYGNATGAVEVAVTGGVAPYLLALDSAALDAIVRFDSLPAGTYSVRVQDDSLCQTQVDFEITQPDSLTLGVADSLNVACFGDSTGLVELRALGGTRPYRYAIDGGGQQPDSGFYNLTAGTYAFTVEDDSACLAERTVVLTEPPALELSLDSLRHVDCYGNDNGYLATRATGGVPGYLFSLNGLGPSPDSVFSDLEPGRYEVLLSDANGCTDQLDSLRITQPDSLRSEVQARDVLCFGEATGWAEVQVQGGTTPYAYTWTPAQGLDTTDQARLNGLTIGTYAVQVVDSQGCALQDTAVIDEPPLLEISLVDTVAAYCNFANGFASVAATGGLGSYTFDWSGLSLTDSIAEDVPGVPYLVQVIDENQCVDSLRFTLRNIPPAEPFFTTDPTADTSILMSQNPIRFDNETVGGVAYLWDFGDGNRSMEEFPTHGYAEPGTYAVTLTADNEFFACPTTYTLTLEIIPDGSIFLPNAFTPNNDGINDRFRIGYEGVVEAEWIIFDQWGRQIQVFNGMEAGWDGRVNGRPAPEGVYVLKLRARLNSGDWVERGGTITLVR